MCRAGAVRRSGVALFRVAVLRAGAGRRTCTALCAGIAARADAAFRACASSDRWQMGRALHRRGHDLHVYARQQHRKRCSARDAARARRGGCRYPMGFEHLPARMLRNRARVRPLGRPLRQGALLPGWRCALYSGLGALRPCNDAARAHWRPRGAGARRRKRDGEQHGHRDRGVPCEPARPRARYNLDVRVARPHVRPHDRRHACGGVSVGVDFPHQRASGYRGVSGGPEDFAARRAARRGRPVRARGLRYRGFPITRSGDFLHLLLAYQPR